MSSSLNTVTIRGFKSVETLEGFELGDLCVLIGANGSGKSNFVNFFRLLRAMADENLQVFVNRHGGADGFFYLGPKHTDQIHGHLEFGENLYEFDLEPSADGLQIADERVQFTGGIGLGTLKSIGSGNRESCLRSRKDESASFGAGYGVPHYVYDAVSSWTVYHFHDTSIVSPMRREQSARDRDRLREDASNIAAFLHWLHEVYPNTYILIRDTIRLIAPFFDNFLLRTEDKGGEEKLRLEWTQKGSDYPFQPVHLSDGTIRFICLATALLQPDPPATIVIDEPELGLHPYAISILADLISSAAKKTQIIISTQSATLLDYFSPENIVTVNRKGGASRFERLDAKGLSDWLDEYTIGELWQKNVVQGGPRHD